MWFPAPRELSLRLLSRLPERHRAPRRTAWADAHLGGREIDSALDAPCFDAAGNLHAVDTAFGRVFRVTPTQWPVVTEYEGWPAGLATGPADSLLLADRRHGLMSLDAATGAIAPLLETARGEGFKGLGAVATGPGGQVLLSDSGRSGLQDASGCLWRFWPDGRLDRLMSRIPGPRGIALGRGGRHAFLAVAGSAEVWRFALDENAPAGMTGLFFRAPGGIAGPAGLAVDAHDRLFVAQPGHGMVWGLDAFGVPVLAIECRGFGRSPTGLCMAPDGITLLVTEADSGSVLSVELPAPG
jgi:gluconolactonase